MKPRRSLVLGGASVLGAHLCERLLADGHEVIAVDDFTSGSFATVAHLKREPRFAFVEHDINTKFDANVDGVFHLAVPSSQRGCAIDPARAALTGVMGTANALEVAAIRKSRVVMATSIERFGEGVRCAERLARDASNDGLAEVRIVRVASAYGPRMALDDAHVVSRMLMQAVRGEDVIVAHDEADRIERVSFVDDAVETLVRSMNDDAGDEEVVAPFVEASVEEIASMILEVVLGGAQPADAPASRFEDGIACTLRAFERRLASVGPPESGFFDRVRSPRADVGT
jgi:UDP-glucuronate decarboxylase